MTRLPASALLIALIVTATACSSGGSPTTTPTESGSASDPGSEMDRLAAAAGCSPVAEHPATSQEHIDPAVAIDYDRLPPEGGEHRAMWSETGVHTEVVDPGEQAHNLEHGHIGLQYDATVSSEHVAVLAAQAASQPEWIFVAPFDAFNAGSVLSLTAWGQRVDCGSSLAGADELGALAEAFIAEHRDNAPESVPGQPIA